MDYRWRWTRMNAAGRFSGRKLELGNGDNAPDTLKYTCFHEVGHSRQNFPACEMARFVRSHIGDRAVGGPIQSSKCPLWTGTIDLTKREDFVFRVYPSSGTLDREYIAKQAVKISSQTHCYSYPNNAFGVLPASLLRSIKASGAEVVAVKRLQDGDRDFRRNLRKFAGKIRT